MHVSLKLAGRYSDLSAACLYAREPGAGAAADIDGDGDGGAASPHSRAAADELAASKSFRVCLVGTEIIVFASRRTVNSNISCFHFNLQTLSWAEPSISGDLVPARAGFAVCALRGGDGGGAATVLVHGGTLRRGKFFQDLYEYNSETNTFQLIETNGLQPPGCAFHSLSANGAYVFAFGGETKKKLSCSTHILDTRTWAWTLVPPSATAPSLTPRCNHTACVMNDTLLIFGGYGGRGKVASDLHYLVFPRGTSGERDLLASDIAALRWRLATLKGRTAGRMAASLIPMSSGLLILGGQVTSSASAPESLMISFQALGLATDGALGGDMSMVARSLPGIPLLPRSLTGISAGEFSRVETGTTTSSSNSITASAFHSDLCAAAALEDIRAMLFAERQRVQRLEADVVAANEASVRQLRLLEEEHNAALSRAMSQSAERQRALERELRAAKRDLVAIRAESSAQHGSTSTAMRPTSTASPTGPADRNDRHALLGSHTPGTESTDEESSVSDDEAVVWEMARRRSDSRLAERGRAPHRTTTGSSFTRERAAQEGFASARDEDRVPLEEGSGAGQEQRRIATASLGVQASLPTDLSSSDLLAALEQLAASTKADDSSECRAIFAALSRRGHQAAQTIATAAKSVAAAVTRLADSVPKTEAKNEKPICQVRAKDAPHSLSIIAVEREVAR